MTNPSNPSLTLQLLERATGGDPQALDALLEHTGARLARLTEQMLAAYPTVRRWAQHEDVLQNALVRLLQAMRAIKPASGRDFFALASLQIRRELIDLARHFSGPEGMGANHDSAARTVDHSDHSHEPSSLAQWTELHRHIEELPEEERDVVGLLFYQGLAQAEAAEVLGLSLRTLQRRWHAALWKLQQIWSGERPS